MIKTDNDSKQNKTVPESAAERAFNFRPLLFAAVFFVLGIVFSFSVIMYDISPWLATLALPIAAGKIALSLRKKRVALIFVALALCFGVGYARFNGVVNGFLSQENYNGAFSVCGVVQERYDYGYKQKLVLVNVEFNGAPVQGKAVVFTDAQAPISLSSELYFSGNVSTDLRLEENGRFRAEAVHQTLCYQVLATSEIVVTGEDFELFRFLRERVFSALYAGLDESVASVSFAILTGETSGMDFSLLENVRFGGVAHLFAVSGLHVGALYGFCTFLLERGKGYRVPKIVRFSLLAVLLCFYGGICGFSPSVVRAIVTCLCFYVRTLTGKSSDTLETVGLAAIVTLFLQPVMAFGLGLQLSFAACLGIVLLHRPLYRHFTIAELAVARGVRTLFHKRDEWDEQPLLNRIEVPALTAPPEIPERIRASITSFLATCVAAQIATLPIQVSAFGYASGISLFVNGLFVPLIGAVFSVLLAFTAVACVLPVSIASAILFVPEVVFSGVLLLFYAVDFSAFALTITFPAAAFVPYYATCVLYTDKLNLSKRSKWALATLFILVCVISVFLYNL